MASPRTWSDLPIDLLQIVCKKLCVIYDFSAFGIVCCSWRSALLLSHKHTPPLVPMLMFPDFSEEHTALSFPNFRKHVLPLKQSLSICYGFSYGWLITRPVPYTNNTLQLLNPFLSVNNVIELSCPEGSDVRKVILSNDPSKTSNYEVIAMLNGLHTGGLIFFRPGDTSWTGIYYEHHTEYLVDMTYYEGQLYGITIDADRKRESYSYYLLSWNINSIPLSLTRVTQSPCSTSLLYLVVSAGDLLYVEWYKAHDIKDTRFRVFKFETRKHEMVELDNLSGHAIFLSLNFGGISVPASNFSDCEPDHIYFSSAHDRTGVFDFIDKTSRRFELPDFNHKKPIWIQPRLNLLTSTTTTGEPPCNSGWLTRSVDDAAQKEDTLHCRPASSFERMDSGPRRKEETHNEH